MKACRQISNLSFRIAMATVTGGIAWIPAAGRAETVLEYVGPALKRFGGDYDPPPEVTSIRLVVVLHDGVPTHRISLAGHSRESHAGKIFKRAELTLGRNTYKFQIGAYMDGDLNITFGAKGKPSDWQIRYFGHFDDIALYGPGSVRPRGVSTEPDVPPVTVCPNADVISSKDRVVRRLGEAPRNYRAIGCGEGAWTVVRKDASAIAAGACEPGVSSLPGFDPDVAAAIPSRDGGRATSIEFTNLNLWPVSIFWVDTNGDLVSRVNRLDPMRSVKLETQGGHAWLAVDQRTGSAEIGFAASDLCTNHAYIFRPVGVPNELKRDEVLDWQTKAAYGYAFVFGLGSAYPPCKLACGAAADFYKFLGDYLRCKDKPLDDKACFEYRDPYSRPPDLRVLPPRRG